MELADFSLTRESTQFLLTPLTPAAQDWADSNLQVEPWQFLSSSIAIDQHCIESILDGLLESGLSCSYCGKNLVLEKEAVR